MRSTSHSCTGEVYLLLGDSCETSFISEGHCRRGMADRKRNEGRLWMECALSLLNGVCLNSNHITETSFHVHCANCIYVTDSLSLPLCPDVPRAKISGAKASCMKREKTHFRIFNPIAHTDLYNLLKFIFLWSDRHGTHTDIYIYMCVFYIYRPQSFSSRIYAAQEKRLRWHGGVLRSGQGKGNSGTRA